MATLRGRGILVLALVSAGWAAVTLAPYPAVRVLVPAVFLAGILAMSRWPVLGATAVCLGQGLGLALGAPHVSAAGLVAGLGAMVLLGRRSRLPRALLPVLTAWGVIVATDLAPVRQVLGLALFAAAYGVGFTVRRAAERATAAEAALRELEAVEVAARARAELEDERHRLSARSTRLVATATRQMRDLALAARPTLDTEDLARLRARGESAVDELRSLLGVLREDGTRAPALPAAEPVAPRRRPPWHADALTTVVLWGIALTVWLMERADAPPPLGAALAIGAVTLRRRAPAAALLIAAAGLVAQRFGGSPYQLGPALAVALALLVWSTVGARTPLRLAALVPLAGATVLVTEPAHDASLEVTCAILLGSGLGSYAWHRLEEGHELARARSETYTRQVELAVASAVGQERLAVARALHDVASGAIGVMMLHASVATVKRTADPVAARTALDDVAAAGDAALVQLALLERALGPGPGEDHEAALELLVARARSHGLDARLELLDVPRDPAAAGVVWRVVHEALTNAVKHAPGARVEVRVARQDEHVVVTVHDDGAPGAEQTPRAAGAPGTGLGLRGLAEQVDLRSGTFRHGPRAAPSPGFMVEARLPDPAE